MGDMDEKRLPTSSSIKVGERVVDIFPDEKSSAVYVARNRLTYCNLEKSL